MDVSFLYGWKGKSQHQEHRSVASSLLTDLLTSMRFLLGVMKMFSNSMVAQPCEYTQNCSIACFKRVSFMVSFMICELYFN